MEITFAWNSKYTVDYSRSRSLSSLDAEGAFLHKGFTINNGFSVKHYEIYKLYLKGKVTDDVEYWYCEYYKDTQPEDNYCMCFRATEHY